MQEKNNGFMLSPEQEIMFNENIKLVHSAINMYISAPGVYGINSYEDLYQDGCMALCKAVQTFKEDRGSFSTYALRIIRNKLYNVTRNGCDHILDKAETLSEPYVEMCISGINNIDIFEERYETEEKFKALSLLGEKYGGIAQKGVEAIILSVQGSTCKEIAELYNTDDRTITSWMSRARQKLQKEKTVLAMFENK